MKIQLPQEKHRITWSFWIMFIVVVAGDNLLQGIVQLLANSTIFLLPFGALLGVFVGYFNHASILTYCAAHDIGTFDRLPHTVLKILIPLLEYIPGVNMLPWMSLSLFLLWFVIKREDQAYNKNVKKQTAVILQMSRSRVAQMRAQSAAYQAMQVNQARFQQQMTKRQIEELRMRKQLQDNRPTLQDIRLAS